MGDTRRIFLVLEGVTKRPNGVRIGKLYLKDDAFTFEKDRLIVRLPETRCSEKTEIEVYL